jgi:MFS superfamily sulfate permease-like transporter
MPTFVRLPSLRAIGSDLPAGLVVYLVALPLCLGIALASDAPLFSGVIAGIVGGMVVTLFSGSELSVSGPAAGLAILVASSVSVLGSFETLLLAVVLAGLMQVGLGFLRAGAIGDWIPHSVIKGMLAAIGFVIVIKQLPHALGFEASFTDAEVSLALLGWLRTLIHPLEAFSAFHPGAMAITALSLAVLIVWDLPVMRRQSWTRLIPGALVAVVLSALVNQVFQAITPAMYLSARNDRLVELPDVSSWSSLVAQLRFPEWSAILRRDVWITALTMMAIASVESLLSIEAVDRMDPERRISDPNAELRAQGIGNIVSGLLGGLPITSVIVRSSANVYGGGRTRLASMVHGLLLLLSIVLIPSYLNAIPLACLASILLVVGYRLSSITIIRSMLREGPAQLIPFAVTLFTVVFTDIITGVAAGVGSSLFWIIRAHHREGITVTELDDELRIRFNKDISFVHKSELRRILRALPAGRNVVIDGTAAGYIDHDVYETLADFDETARHAGIAVTYTNVHGKQKHQD